MAEPTDDVHPRSDAEAVNDSSVAGVATTAARALAIGAALSAPDALTGLREEFDAIGIVDLPRTWYGTDDREEAVAASDRLLLEHGIYQDVIEREVGSWRARTEGLPSRHAARLDLWEAVRRDPTKARAVAWLRTLMVDDEPVASAAAAAALSHFHRQKDRPTPMALDAARRLTKEYAKSEVRLAREIAIAARGDSGRSQNLTRGTNSQRREGASSTSLIVHGTAAYAGSWWFVGGDFHDYVRTKVRPDLFSGRNAFSWSGAYRGGHRGVAAERLAGWAADTVGGPLNTVFAHSYGGAIALNATAYGLEINELVLLSTPVEPVPVEWRNIGRAASLRIHWDLVLLAARRRQLFTENVEENHLPAWFIRHGDSHDPSVWLAESCATSLRL